MSASEALTLSKKERICSRTLIEKLFNGGGSHSMTFFPLRVVYMPMTHEADEDAWDKTQAQMLISVPKRYFKRAVKRNRGSARCAMLTVNISPPCSPSWRIAAEVGGCSFIWPDSKLYSSNDVEWRVQNLISRIAEKI